MADLEIRDLHVRIEEREILKGVDLEINRGEIHALMGPNGSGKSTLANTLLGHPTYEITEGSIIFKGEDITAADPSRSRACRSPTSCAWPSTPSEPRRARARTRSA
jgi:Fe-S cluster assembly ATP-binding protein